MAMGQVHDSQQYALTLVGNNLISDRRTIFRGIPVDPRGRNGEMLTVRELCTFAPFQVYSVEFETPCPGRDPPAPAKAQALISLVDCEDDTGAGVRPPSAPASGPPSGPAGPPSPPVFGRPCVGQVYAAKALLVARSPSPQAAGAVRQGSPPWPAQPRTLGTSPLWPAQARNLGSSPGPYLRMSASPDLHAPGWPPRLASPAPPSANLVHLYGGRTPVTPRAMSPVTPRAASPLLPSRMLASAPPRSPQDPSTSATYIPAAAPKPTPTHVCDANCGFEGSKDEVLRHEKDCEPWRAWKQIQLARRRDNERKRKERVQNQALARLALVTDVTVDVDYLAYLAGIPTATAGAGSTFDDKSYDLERARKRQNEGLGAASSSKSDKPGKRQRKRTHRAALALTLPQQAVEDADAAEVQAAKEAHLAKQKRLFRERTQADALGFAKQLEDNVPDFWTAESGEHVEVTRGSDEFAKIEASFAQGLGVDAHAWPSCDYQIRSLWRTVNREQWTAFEMRRMQASRLQATPEQTSVPHAYPNDTKLLWHGTAAGSAAAIMKYGFNRSAGANGHHGAVLGRGSYFSPLPRLCLSGEKGCLSHVYTPLDGDGFKHLLLCNVHLGNSIKGRTEYHSFPPAVHSTVDSLLSMGKVCVQHDSSINVLYEVVVSYKR